MDTDGEDGPRWVIGRQDEERAMRFDAPPMDRDVRTAEPSSSPRADREPRARARRRSGTRDSASSVIEAEAEATTSTNTDTAATRVASRLALADPRRRRG